MLTNEELRLAIMDSFEQKQRVADVDQQKKIIQEHIDALRAEQLRRARENVGEKS